MSLLNEREMFRKLIEKNGCPQWPVLEDYRANRNSNSWRTTTSLERICEYIIYLENKVENETSI